MENSGGSGSSERMLLEDALRGIQLRDGWMGRSGSRSTPEVEMPQTLQMKPEEVGRKLKVRIQQTRTLE